MAKWTLDNLKNVMTNFKNVLDDVERLKVNEIRSTLNDIYDQMIIIKGLIVCKNWPQEIDSRLTPDLLCLCIIAIQEYTSRINIEGEWDKADLAQINTILYKIQKEFNRWINEFSKITHENYQNFLDNLVLRMEEF